MELLDSLDTYMELLKHKLTIGGVEYSTHPNSLNSLTEDLQLIYTNSVNVTRPDYTGKNSVESFYLYDEFLRQVISYVDYDDSVSGWTGLVEQLQVTPSLSLVSDKGSYSSGDTVTLTAGLSYKNNNISGVTIKFYNNNTLLYTGTTGADGTCNYSFEYSTETSIYCVCEETNDYNNVTSTTITVIPYLYAPLLDGSEELRAYQDRTIYIEDNMLQGTEGLLVEGWDNTGDWILEMDYYLQGVDGEGIDILPNTNTKSVMGEGLGIIICNYGQGFGVGHRVVTNQIAVTRISSSRPSGWLTLKLTKIGDNFEVVTNNGTVTFTNNVLSTFERMTVGNDLWYNGEVKIKNIRVSSL